MEEKEETKEKVRVKFRKGKRERGTKELIYIQREREKSVSKY